MEDKIKALADGTLDDMRKALPGLSGQELTALRTAEQAGKKRSGAIEMIDDAVKAPGQSSVAVDTNVSATPLPDANVATGVVAATLPDGDGDSDVYRHEGVILMVPKDRAALIVRLHTALDEGESVAIVFADADGELLDVPPIEAKAGDFQHFGGGHPQLIYKPRILLPMELPAVAVRQIFLLVEPMLADDGPAAVAVCKLTADLHAGGGRKAEIPDGNLLFSLG